MNPLGLTKVDGMIMRAVIYTRVSHDNNQARSVLEQEEECRRICQLMGWTVIKVISDNHRSASRFATKARERYPEVLRMVEDHEVEVVVLWESSRGQRDMADFVYLRDLCAKAGVLYSYSGKTYDMNRTDDRFNSGIDALVAERYAGETRDRVLRNLRKSAMLGLPHGRLPYGYGRKYAKNGDFVEQYIIEEEAKVLRDAAERILDGDSCRRIAKDLNTARVPAPDGNKWYLGGLRRLLINPRLAGLRVHRGVVVGKAVWPAILDEEVYASVHARLTDPRRGTIRDGSVKHLLTGTAKCEPCGAPMRIQKNGGDRGHSYTCSEGSHASIGKEVLEAYVSEVVIERLGREDARFVFQRPDTASQDAAEAMADLAVLSDRLAQLAAGAAAGRISEGMLGRIEAELLPQIAAAERRARPAPVSPALALLLGATDVRAMWLSLEVAAQREVVHRIMHCRVRPAGRGRRTFDPSRVPIEFRT